jgi:hypothetical protein
MRIGRTLGWLSIFAGLATYFAARSALRQRQEKQRTDMEEGTRWETDGGATIADAQPPDATI